MTPPSSPRSHLWFYKCSAAFSRIIAVEESSLCGRLIAGRLWLLPPHFCAAIGLVASASVLTERFDLGFSPLASSACFTANNRHSAVNRGFIWHL